MTLIVLLILAAVSLSAVFSEKGIFNKAETAGAKYNEAKAREVLETVLLADGQYEKNINPEYNQDEFLNKLIISEIPGTEIKGDVAIISGWAFELDRSVPKIGRTLGRADKIIFPTINAEAKLATDKKNATINITAKEEKNGINKIEIWLLEEKIKEYTYDPTKPEVTETYTATQNGKYTIKAYGDLMASKTVEVTEIVASVTFEPNGNNQWKKEHSTKVTIQETADKVVKAKYVWTNSVTAPEDSQFSDTQTFKSGDKISKDGVTGIYYLWTMLETQSGEKLKWRSEGFNFDNEGPIVTLNSIPVSETSFKLTATASDVHSEISKYEFYVNGVKIDRPDSEATLSTITKDIGVMSENINCEVVVYDGLGNSTRTKETGRTLLHTWDKWDTKVTGTKKVRQRSQEEKEFTKIRKYTGGNTNKISASKSEPDWINESGLSANPNPKIYLFTQQDYDNAPYYLWCAPSTANFETIWTCEGYVTEFLGKTTMTVRRKFCRYI